MNAIDPHNNTPTRSRIPWWWWPVGLIVAFCWDRAFYLAFPSGDHTARIESADWYQILRQAGNITTWLFVVAAFLLVDLASSGLDRWRAGLRRGVYILLITALSGLAAELLKLVFRRLRPEAADGLYAFRPILEDTLRTGGLGFPSSHAAVAFGAAFALSAIFRPAAPVFFLLAAGCSLTRLIVGAHFLSDVFGGLAVAYAVFLWIDRIDLRNNQKNPIHLHRPGPA